jgi:hypothetical protein
MTMRPGHAMVCAVGCLCTTVAVSAGCGAPLCPSTVFPAQIRVQLAPDWLPTPDLEITIACPPGHECGFLEGPKTGSASRPVVISTVLRPPQVDVRVRSTTDGTVVRVDRLTVDYQVMGPRHTDCGSDDLALLFVPAG